MVTRPDPDLTDETILKTKPDSRISGFYKQSLEQRLQTLLERGVLTEQDVHLLSARRGGLPLSTADKMVENLIGVMELPLSWA